MAAAEHERPLDFIREIVRDDLASGRHAASSRASRPSRTATSTSGTPRRSASTSASPRSTAAAATCASTTPTRPPRRPSSSRRSRPTCAGSASTGARTSTSPRTTSRSSTTSPCELIERGKAFVCDLSSEEIAAHRGTLTEPGTAEPVPRRAASPRTSTCSSACARGEFAPGAQRAAREDRHGLAEPDDARPDPLPDRATHAAPPHRRRVVRSTRCTTSRTASRTRSRASRTRSARSSSSTTAPLYDWILDELELPEPHPQQIEFARGNLSHTVMSKRLLRSGSSRRGTSRGWDDPRMPTLAGHAPPRLPAAAAPPSFCERRRHRQARQPDRAGAARGRACARS